MKETDPTTGERAQFYRNPTFLGVLIGVGALIVVVIVCLLLVAFRGGHISLDKIHGKCYHTCTIISQTSEQLAVVQEDLRNLSQSSINLFLESV